MSRSSDDCELVITALREFFAFWWAIRDNHRAVFYVGHSPAKLARFVLETSFDTTGLSRRALIAFAVRCAIRVRPWYTRPDSDVIDRTIEMLVVEAAGGQSKRVNDTIADVAKAEATARNAADADISMAFDYQIVIDAEIASVVAQAARFARPRSSLGIDEIVSRSVKALAHHAGGDNVITAAKRDIKNLRELLEEGVESFDVSDTGPLGPLWPDGVSVGKADAAVAAMKLYGGGEFSPPPSVVIVWDPEVVTEGEYADLVKALGDVVRQNGGAGVKLLRSQSFGVDVEAGVYQ